MAVSPSELNLVPKDPGVVRIQIAFSKEADLFLVAGQINKMLENNAKSDHNECRVEYICGFLARRHVEEKGWSTNILDLLDKKFGDNLKYYTEEYETFDDVMKNMTTIRKDLKADANLLFVFGERMAKGVIEEIAIASGDKIKIFAEDETVYYESV